MINKTPSFFVRYREVKKKNSIIFIAMMNDNDNKRRRIYMLLECKRREEYDGVLLIYV